MGNLLIFKRLRDDVTLPTKAHPTDAGYDIYAPEDIRLLSDRTDSAYTSSYACNHSHHVTHTACLLPLGFAMAIPDGYVGIIAPRSSTGIKGLEVVNTIGVIDSGYRGEVTAFLHNKGDDRIDIHKGDRILQLVILPIPSITVVEADELPPSSRGDGGFGSTGK